MEKFVMESHEKEKAVTDLRAKITNMVHLATKKIKHDKYGVSVWSTFEDGRHDINLMIYTGVGANTPTEIIFHIREGFRDQDPPLTLAFEHACQLVYEEFLRVSIGFYLNRMAKADELTRSVINAITK